MYTSNLKKFNVVILFFPDNIYERNRVIDEWRYANGMSTPCLLLIEDGRVNPAFRGNCIKFNRKKPEPAIREINRRMEYIGHPKANDDVWIWLIGGKALIAVIELLSDV